MTKARDIADFKFENITDTGTEGTKVATGTTAQRGSTAGQLRFNSETGLAEYYTGTEFKSIDSPPTVSSVNISFVDSQAGGNQTIVITGSGFNSGATVTFVGNSGTDFNASTVTVDNNTQITAVAPKSSFLNAQEPYGIKVINVSGLSATLNSQINVDTAPSFSVASGSLGTLSDANRSASNLTAVTATDADADSLTFTISSGTIPTGLTFNSNGTWSGTANAESSSQTYNFTVQVTDGNTNVTRNYSITVNPPIIASYLVIAGGGGGGTGVASPGRRGGGGGGAGGYKNSYASETSGRNSSTESKITLNSGTTYTITVGAGGSGASSGTGNSGQNGNNSSISGSGLTTITSNGGGYGTGNANGNSGGSGGGAMAGTGDYPPQYYGGSGTANQGFDGANGNINVGGGGGGATENGDTDGVGTGGDGLASSITGSSVTRAGGGGAGGTQSAGGDGGGGIGGPSGGVPLSPGNGTANTGGGGGGGNDEGQGLFGANGGSGVVILRLATALYSGTTTGSPTVDTDGTDTILTFNSSGSYTA
jgi:hypothetical protein